MKKFICKWDWLNIIFSSFVIFFLLLGIPYIVEAFIEGRYLGIIWMIFMISLWGYYAFQALYHCPTSVEKEGDKLRINYLIGKEELNINGCIAEKVHKDFTIMNFIATKNLATRPLIGYWGHYHNSTGKYRFCFTDRKHNLCILTIKGEEEKLIINAPYEWFDFTPHKQNLFI